MKYTEMLFHSAKGIEWKKHKYIAKKNGRYIYAKNSKGGKRTKSKVNIGRGNSKQGLDAKYGEYSENDPDFNDSNYDEKFRLGDTDFYGFEKPDGTMVILEEDMKWTLPAGSYTKNELVDALEQVSNRDHSSNNAFVQDVTLTLSRANQDGRGSGATVNTNISKMIQEKISKVATKANVLKGKERVKGYTK